MVRRKARETNRHQCDAPTPARITHIPHPGDDRGSRRQFGGNSNGVDTATSPGDDRTRPAPAPTDPS
ncbi:hypothetical protein GCM10018781_06240 [Kitasatospora indigofera]|uniref:Uncharacterized protein n=1 Tax=Kitasatospora indigofera TaxID=67307 RepID=A0A919KK82_9ACTN|nr:hypothetical protein GCM10018781_06240 [Kitasatospora indigofera]